MVRIAIGEVRRALGDTAQAPQYITTVARRGYRFVVQVTEIASPEAAPTGALRRAPLEPRVSEVVPPIPDARATQAEETTSWRCAVCQQPQGPAARFCVACGTPRIETCPSCGQAVSMPATFCSRVWTTAGRTAARGPRPVSRDGALTTAAGVSGRHPTCRGWGTQAGHRALLRPGRLHRPGGAPWTRDHAPPAEPVFDLALGEVRRYEGTINQFLGDGFMALFGAPIAHEDTPGAPCWPRWDCNDGWRSTAQIRGAYGVGPTGWG